MLKIAGINFENIAIVDEVIESFAKVYDNQPQKMQDGSTWYDVIGTEYTHTVTLRRNPTTSDADWDTAWAAVASPAGNVTVEIDHKQTTMSYTAHISAGSRPMLSKAGNRKTHGDITITFVPVSPQEVS